MKINQRIKEAIEYSDSLKNEIAGTNKKLEEFKVIINDDIENQFHNMSSKLKKQSNVF